MNYDSSSPAVQITSRIMVEIAQHIKEDPPPHEASHYNRVFEKVLEIVQIELMMRAQP